MFAVVFAKSRFYTGDLYGSYIRPVYTGELSDTRKYGPYVRVSEMHPYVRAVHTARTYGP